MRLKEGPGNLGKREDERRKGWGRREWKTESKRMREEERVKGRYPWKDRASRLWK